GVLDDCSAACRRGFVWRARYFSASTNGGDWSADGFGCSAVAHLPFDGRQGAVPERDWYCDWPARRLWTYARSGEHARRGEAHGSRDVCVSRSAFLGYCCGGFVASGTARVAIGSDYGAEE